jgi:N-methylhydantoinase A
MVPSELPEPRGQDVANAAKRTWLGIDVGGTFVDFALFDEGDDVFVHKLLANPSNLAGSIMDGIAELATVRNASLEAFLGGLQAIVHGTTVATNAVLTGTGSRTGLLTTRGTRDALEMRRGIKEEPLNNKYQPPPPLVPRYLRLPIDERIGPHGAILTKLDPGSLDRAVDTMTAQRVESVAICLMHAYANGSHEETVARLVRQKLPEVYVTVSSELLPQLGYYNRVSTTVLNSYVGPLLRSYLLSLSSLLRSAGFSGQLLIMNSAAGVMSPEEMTQRAATALLSGPSAAPIAGRLYARATRASDCVVIDMGGTSLDISLTSDGEPRVVTEGRIDRYAIALPMIDIRTIGAGGGSIAWVDAGHGLQVGPRSAGAAPGPACYQNGGEHPTCTDVDVVLGYIDPDYFLGGRIKLARSLAEEAIRKHVADPLHIGIEEAAMAAFEVVNTNMATGIRDMIVDHGLDPQEMPLVVGGGAGPVHAAAIAMELGISEVIVPPESAVFCAVGMLFADLKHELIRSYCVSSDKLDPERWRMLFQTMAAEGRKTLLSEGAKPEEIETHYSVDLHYQRQIHDLNLPLEERIVEKPDVGVLRQLFGTLHERLFGYRLSQQPLEIVNLRVRSMAKRAKPELLRSNPADVPPPKARHWRRAYSVGEARFREFPVYHGEDIGGQLGFTGPAIVELPQTTVVVPAAFDVRRDATGSFVLSRNLLHE